MTKNKKQEWNIRREIPDMQIRDAADQYETARQLLAAQPPGLGILLPLMNVSVMAIELYLKCLSAKKVYIPITHDLETHSINRVYSEPIVGGHVLTNIFSGIPDDIRDELARTYERTMTMPSGTFCTTLAQFENALMTTRYPYEEKAELSNIDLNGLMSLSSFLKEFVASLEPRETISWD